MLSSLVQSRATKVVLLTLIVAIAALLTWALVSDSATDKGPAGRSAPSTTTSSRGAQAVHASEAPDSGRPETIRRRSLP
jgi:hypothetical protein